MITYNTHSIGSFKSLSHDPVKTAISVPANSEFIKIYANGSELFAVTEVDTASPVKGLKEVSFTLVTSYIAEKPRGTLLIECVPVSISVVEDGSIRSHTVPVMVFADWNMNL